MAMQIQELHWRSRGSYGARRISEELIALGESCDRTKVATFMQLANISAKQKRRFNVTTNSNHRLPVAPNLLQRDFTALKTDAVYCLEVGYT